MRHGSGAGVGTPDNKGVGASGYGLGEILIVMSGCAELLWVLGEGVSFTRIHRGGGSSSLFEEHHSRGHHTVYLCHKMDLINVSAPGDCFWPDEK